MTNDAAIPTELLQLAQMGSHGVHQNNTRRDLMRLMKNETLLPEPFMTRFPMNTEAKSAFQSVMLPHMVFHSLYKDYETYWKENFLPQGKKQLGAFWEAFSSHPAMQDETMKSIDSKL